MNNRQELETDLDKALSGQGPVPEARDAEEITDFFRVAERLQVLVPAPEPDLAASRRRFARSTAIQAR